MPGKWINIFWVEWTSGDFTALVLGAHSGYLPIAQLSFITHFSNERSVLISSLVTVQLLPFPLHWTNPLKSVSNPSNWQTLFSLKLFSWCLWHRYRLSNFSSTFSVSVTDSQLSPVLSVRVSMGLTPWSPAFFFFFSLKLDSVNLRYHLLLLANDSKNFTCFLFCLSY